MIKFSFNKQKATEAILYLAKKEPSISKMRLLKFMFFADCYHINKYGRPILGDRYVAMDNGPVLSKLYDMLKCSTDDYTVINNKITAMRESDNDYFSNSDIEALEYSFNQYSQYETLEMSDLSHESEGWKKARNANPHSKNPSMYWENLIENEDVLKELKEYSEAIVF